MSVWERIILEVQGLQGGSNVVGPGRFASFDFKPSNFETRDTETPFPYDDSIGGGPQNATDAFTAPSGHQRGRGRPDVSGGPPEPSSTYDRTWQGMHEAMGQPSVTGPFVSMDGPSMRGGRDAGPVQDEEGEPITEPQMQDIVDPKMGPNNMWGGAGTIPGQDRGFAASPMMGDNNPEATKWKPPEERKMNLREFFDPETPPAETVEEPGSKHEKDQTDDEIENKLDRIYGQEDNHEFDDGKEPDDNSAKFEPVGSPDEEAADARDNSAPGAIPPPDDGRAGLVMLDDEPAGFVSMGGDDLGGDEGEEPAGPDDSGEMDLGAGPAATVDAQDWQLTVEPEAGGMPALSQMMGGDNLVGKKGADGIQSMTQAAQGLLPKKDSSWDEMAIQVGDAIINLRKTGGTPPAGPPPMQESIWSVLAQKTKK